MTTPLFAKKERLDVVKVQPFAGVLITSPIAFRFSSLSFSRRVHAVNLLLSHPFQKRFGTIEEVSV
jgi:hypothetical protein